MRYLGLGYELLLNAPVDDCKLNRACHTCSRIIELGIFFKTNVYTFRDSMFNGGLAGIVSVRIA